MSDKYAALASYAQHMVETGRYVAPFTSREIVEVLAEREADKARIAELESRKLVFIEPDRCSCVGYHIDEAYLEADPEGDCYDRDEVLEALQKCCAAAGITLETGE